MTISLPAGHSVIAWEQGHGHRTHKKCMSCKYLWDSKSTQNNVIDKIHHLAFRGGYPIEFDENLRLEASMPFR